jgi:hypothetical protein
MEELDLFHISCEKYKVGDIINAPEETNYHKNTKDNGYEWVDLLLDSFKPEVAPSRKSTLYAFDNPNLCVVFFGSRKCANEGPFLYRVRMLDPIKVPMSIVGCISKNEYDNEKLAQEYWCLTEEWGLYEYLSIQMEVLEIIPITFRHRGSNATELIIADQSKIKKKFAK